MFVVVINILVVIQYTFHFFVFLLMVLDGFHCFPNVQGFWVKVFVHIDWRMQKATNECQDLRHMYL